MSRSSFIVLLAFVQKFKNTIHQDIEPSNTDHRTSNFEHPTSNSEHKHIRTMGHLELLVFRCAAIHKFRHPDIRTLSQPTIRDIQHADIRSLQCDFEIRHCLSKLVVWNSRDDQPLLLRNLFVSRGSAASSSKVAAIGLWSHLVSVRFFSSKVVLNGVLKPAVSVYFWFCLAPKNTSNQTPKYTDTPGFGNSRVAHFFVQWDMWNTGHVELLVFRCTIMQKFGHLDIRTLSHFGHSDIQSFGHSDTSVWLLDSSLSLPSSLCEIKGWPTLVVEQPFFLAWFRRILVQVAAIGLWSHLVSVRFSSSKVVLNGVLKTGCICIFFDSV